MYVKIKPFKHFQIKAIAPINKNKTKKNQNFNGILKQDSNKS